MKKIIFILSMLFCPTVFAATLTTNTVPYVCQGGSTPQLCNSNMTTDSSGNLLSGSMFIPNNIQVFTSSGTWTKPAGVSKVYVKVIGAGGGGGAGYGSPADGAGGGGGGGGYAEGVISVTGNVTVTIGTTNSFAGTTTISATSGSAGSQGNSQGGRGGSGGTGSGGAINITGSTGSGGESGANSSHASGGIGGGTPMGSGGGGGVGSAVGSTGGSYGGGGGGSGSNITSTSTGDPGAVIVYY